MSLYSLLNDVLSLLYNISQILARVILENSILEQKDEGVHIPCLGG
jgi:hypothetical protein